MKKPLKYIKLIDQLRKQYKSHKIWRVTILLSPVVIYLFFSVFFFALKHNFSLTNSIFTQSADPELFIWSLNWWPFAIAHHLNPFITKYIWYPVGFNLTWATSIPALALLLFPVTHFLGAITSFNLTAVLAPVLSATSMFYLIYVITKKYTPSLISGYIFGFSSYELGQLIGHAQLYVTFCIPLLIMLFILRYQQRIKRYSFILLSALLIIIQFGISTELFATLLVFTAITVLVFLSFSDKKTRIHILKTVLELGLSIILSLILLSPFLYYLLKGYSTEKEIAPKPSFFSYYSTDLLNFIIPTPITALGHAIFRKTATKFAGNIAEEGSYLGIPFILIFAYISIKNRKSLIFKSLAILFIILAISSLGPILHIDGNSENMTLPWNFASHLPLLSSAIPDRFSMYVFLILALLVGLWLSSKSTKRNCLIKFLVVIIAIVFILPNTSIYSWRTIHQPKIFKPTLVSRYIRKGSNVIVFPYGFLGNSMLYQYKSGMDFTQSGGYISPNLPLGFANSSLVESFYSNSALNNFKPSMIRFCKQNRISSIIYMPGTSSSIIKELKSLHWATITIGSSTIMYVTHKELAE